jgi:hypothetical protein
MTMPIWLDKINLADVFHNEEMSFEQRRDVIVQRIRRSGWPDRNSSVYDLIDELADCETGNEFDGPWSLIYDEADADRVWIATF